MRKNSNAEQCELSIIIPIYNQEAYLKDCINSVLEQDMENYQVLLIDDGSTDGSADICKHYVRQHTEFQYIYQENSNAGNAKNTGILHANGRYLLFLDADDALKTDSLKTLCRYMDENGLDILYMDEVLCDERMKTESINVTFPFMQTRIKKEEALRYCLQPAHTASRIYGRELFEQIRYMDIWYEDMACFPELVSVSKNIGYYKAPVYYYRQHQDSITHQKEDARNLDVIKAWNRIYHIPGLSEAERRALESSLRRSVTIFLFFRANYAKEYLRWYEEAMAAPQALDLLFADGFSEDIFTEDYPLLQQARIGKDQELVRNLEILEEVYYTGGMHDFTDAAGINADSSSTEQLTLFIEDEQLKLHSISIRRKSPVIQKIFAELSKQNLISLRGERKEFVLEKILVQTFMDYGLPIYVRE